MSLKKNILYSISINVLNLLFPIVTVPYISRILGADHIGLVSFATTYVSYFSLFAALGVNYYGVRELAKHKHDQSRICKIYSELFFITCLSTFIASLIFFVSVMVIPELRKERMIFIIAGISLYLIPISIDWLFQALENFKIITIRSLIIKGCAFFSLFVFVRDRNDVINYLLISSFATIGANLWNVVYAKKSGYSIQIKKIDLKQHIKPMFIFLGSNVAVNIFVMLDVVMLGLMADYKQVAYFSSPNKILMLIIAAFGAINAVLLPRLSRNNQACDYSSNEQLLQKIFDITALFIIPLSVGLCLMSSRFVPFFFGRDFIGCIGPMQILSFKVIVVMINSFFALNVLVALGHEKQFLQIVVWTALVSLVMNCFLIPFYGAVGASISAVIAETIQIFLNLFFVYKATRIRIKWKIMTHSAVCSIPILVLCFLSTRLFSADVSFLIFFVICSGVVYLMIQYFFARNYILIEIKHSFINRFLK